jgi:tight adherence protein B
MRAFVMPETIAIAMTLSILGIAFLSWHSLKSAFVRYQIHSADALSSMFLFVSTAQLLTVSVIFAAITGAVVAWISQNLYLAIPPIILSLAAPQWFFKHFSHRRHREINQQLPGAIESIAQAMKAGISFTQAFENTTKLEVGPLAQEFSLVLRQIRMGGTWETALHSLEARISSEAIQFLVSGILISREVGGNLADILLSLSHTMRRIHDVEKKIEALTAQGRMQGIVMTCLPVFLGLCLSLLEPEAMSQLWTTPIGWAVAGVSVVLLSIGYFFIRKIIGVAI